MPGQSRDHNVNMWRSRLSSLGLLPLVIAALVLVAIVVSVTLGRSSLGPATSAGRWEELLAFAFLCALISFAALEIRKRLLPARELLQRHFLV